MAKHSTVYNGKFENKNLIIDQSIKVNIKDILNTINLINEMNPDFITSIKNVLERLNDQGNLKPLIDDEILLEIEREEINQLNELSKYIDWYLQGGKIEDIKQYLQDEKYINYYPLFNEYLDLFSYIIFTFSKEIKPHLADSATDKGKILTSLRDIKEFRYDLKRCLYG